jgi:ankyrin repeat protein
MQRIITWQSFDRFLEKYPELDIISSAVLDPVFKQWVTNTVNHGIDGEILLKVLSDRSFDLMASFPHFAQKVLNNELGTVLDQSGKEPALLDFYLACERGFVEEVELYCSCRMPVNEETTSRISNEILRPLSLAAAGGHTEVVKVLIRYHVDVNAIDRRGRTALHLAASKGHTETCNILIDAGAFVFRGDHQGNSPLHLAALANNFETIDFLAQKSQDLTRYITTDKVRVNPGMSFDQLVEKVYELMPQIKLKHTETQRFEKLWLSDTASKLRELCDKKVQFMLPQVSYDIMLDVLDRFDPRPETGVLLSVAVGNQINFIPTIPGPQELSILLRRAYYLASVDPVNNFKRTPLHLACDANHVDSHAKVIDLLVEKYGCNLLMKDRQGKTPIDMLIIERNVVNAPSATKAREDLLIESREVQLKQYSDMLLEEERISTQMRQQAIMNACIRRGEMISEQLWHVVRQASILKTRYHDWEVYEDPDTLNYFYCRRTEDALHGLQYVDYSWIPSFELRYIRDRHMGLQYQRLVRSKLLRKIGPWEMLQCSTMQLVFYYNAAKAFLSYKAPIEAQFKTLLPSAHHVDDLGFSNEWEELVDAYDNVFYRNADTNICQWERPIDAIKVTDLERFCTAHEVIA